MLGFIRIPLGWIGSRLAPLAGFLPGPISLLFNPWVIVGLGLAISHGWAFAQGKGWSDRAWQAHGQRTAHKLQELNQRLDMAATERDAAMEHAAREAFASIADSGQPPCTLDSKTLARLKLLTGGSR
jgi:hypothetical protein